jgi:hypothetical protein
MKKGIIAVKQNLFAVQSWIDQEYRLTKHRSEQLCSLFGETIDKINQMNRNQGKYVAFVGIRWGFAEIKGNKLIHTKKWDRKLEYDDYGNKH